MQAVLRLFYLAVVHHEVVTASSLRSSAASMHSPTAGAALLLSNAAFAGRLTFVLRPLLARSDLLLCLLAGQPPPPPPPLKIDVSPSGGVTATSRAIETVAILFLPLSASTHVSFIITHHSSFVSYST